MFVGFASEVSIGCSKMFIQFSTGLMKVEGD